MISYNVYFHTMAKKRATLRHKATKEGLLKSFCFIFVSSVIFV